jgi:hypothetical protein
MEGLLYHTNGAKINIHRNQFQIHSGVGCGEVQHCQEGRCFKPYAIVQKLPALQWSRKAET